MQNGSSSPRYAQDGSCPVLYAKKILHLWEKHCPEVFAPVILVLLEGQGGQLWQYKLQRRSWFTLSSAFVSQFPGRNCGALRTGQHSSPTAELHPPRSYEAETDLAMWLGRGCPSNVKHTIFMPWLAPRLEEGLQLKTTVPRVVLWGTLWGLARTVVQRNFPHALSVQMLLYESMFHGHRSSWPRPVWQRASRAPGSPRGPQPWSLLSPFSFGAQWINCMDFLYGSNTFFFFNISQLYSHLQPPDQKSQKWVHP